MSASTNALLRVRSLYSNSYAFSHSEKHCGDITQPHQTFLIGLCSGLWASSAISVSPSLPDLVHIGVQFVVFAFKTGTYVHSVSQHMSQTSDRSRSWTYIFTGLDHDTVPAKLDAFNREFVRISPFRTNSR